MTRSSRPGTPPREPQFIDEPQAFAADRLAPGPYRTEPRFDAQDRDVDPDRRIAERLAPRNRAAEPLRRPRRGLGLGTVVGWSVALLLVAAVATVGLFYLASPVDLIRRTLVAEVKARTGRDLVISGASGITVFPSLGIRLADVTLSAPPGMGGPPTIVMKSLEVRVAAMPLLSKRVVIERLVLRQPVFDLRVDGQGRQSWQFGALDGDHAPRVRLAQAGTKGEPVPAELEAFIRGSSQKQPAPGEPSAAGKPAAGKTSPASASASALDQISLGDVRIEDGVVTYSDQRTGLVERVTGLNAVVRLPSLAEPATLKGDAVLREQKLDLDVRLLAPDALLAGRPTKLEANLSGAPLKARYEGTATLGVTPTSEGDVKIEARSLGEFMRFAGRNVAAGADLGALLFVGRLKTGAETLTVSDASLKLGPTTISGTATVEVRRPRPFVRAQLESPELDIARLRRVAQAIAEAPMIGPAPAPKTEAVVPPVARTPANRKVTPPAEPAAPAAAPAPRTIEEIIQQSGGGATRVKGYTQRDGWSDEPIDASALGLVDAEVRLVIGRILNDKLKLGATLGTVSLKDQVLRLKIDDLKLYDGTAKGTIALDGTKPAVKLDADITLDGVAVGPLLADAADVQAITGRGRATFIVTSRGASERQLVAGLGGKASLLFTDGALVGYNIPGLMRSLQQLKFDGLDRNPTEKTDFSELAASFTIASGIATTQDIRMASPLIRLAGAGTISLPPRTLDLRLKPKVVGTLTGQGGEANATGLEIPVRLEGSWDRPALKLDGQAVTEVLKDPAKATEVVKQIGDQLQNGKGGDLVRGFINSLGGGGKPKQ